MKKIHTILLAALACLASCDDSVLEREPIDKFGDEAVWGDPTLTQAYVFAQYNAITHGFTRHWLAKFCDETYGDDGFLKGNLSPDVMPGGGYPERNGWINYWNHGYLFLRNINIFFERIDQTGYEQEKIDEFKGQMHFVRAYIYFNLFKRYGGVPIIERVFKLGDDFTVTRARAEETIAYIASELDKAMALLPAIQRGNDKGKASQAAARALKARLYLYAASPLWNPTGSLGKWQQAKEATDDFLQQSGGEFSLYHDYASLFLDQEKGDVGEVIFAQHFSINKFHHGQQINTPPGYGGWGGWSGKNVPTQNLIDAYETTDGEVPYIWPSGTDTTTRVRNPDNTVYDPNDPYANRDPRFYAAILYDGVVYRGREFETFLSGEEGVLPGEDSPEDDQSGWDKTVTGYNIRKFMNDALVVTRSVPNTNPWIHMRLAEVYLNYAEIMYRLGDEATARDYVNRVRARPGVAMPPIDDSGPDLWDRIVNERRVELAFENHRFWDVRRWKIAMVTENRPTLGMRILKMKDGTKKRRLYTIVPRLFEEKHYLIPIPQTEIDKTGGTLAQNPGY